MTLSMEITFHAPLLSYLDMDRRTSQVYCNYQLTINQEGDCLPLHKCVLGLASKYFQRLFCDEKESDLHTQLISHQDLNTFGIKCSGDTIKAVIHFMYTREIVLSPENVYDILDAAVDLEVADLKTKAVEYLKSTITDENWLQIYIIACKISDDSLLSTCLSQFDQFKEMISFEALSIDYFTPLIESKRLILEASTVFDTIMSWVRHRRDEEQVGNLETLLKFVDFAEMSLANIQNALNDPIIRRSNDAMIILSQSVLEQANTLSRNAWSPILPPRNPSPPRKTEEKTSSIPRHNPPSPPNQYFSETLPRKIQKSPTSPPNFVETSATVRLPTSSETTSPKNNIRKIRPDFAPHVTSHNPNRLRSNTPPYVHMAPLPQPTDPCTSTGLTRNRIEATSDRNPSSSNSSFTDFSEGEGEEILIVGGMGIRAERSVERYCPLSSSVKKFKSSPKPCAGSCAVLVGRTVVIAGGYDKGKFMPHLQLYNSAANTWKVLKCVMKTGRSDAAAAVHHDIMYVAGGSFHVGPDQVLSSIEVINCKDGEFSLDKNAKNFKLKYGRSGHAVVMHNGVMYVIGGYCGSGAKQHHRVCEAINVVTGEHSEIAPLRDVRNQLSATLFRNEIVVAGGQSENGTRTSTVEAYSFVTEQWSYFPALTVPRSGHRLCVCNTKLYAVGGFSEKSAEFYDSEMASAWVSDSFFESTLVRDRSVVINVSEPCNVLSNDSSSYIEVGQCDFHYEQPFLPFTPAPELLPDVSDICLN